MANNLYTTKTAALKATKADINNLNVKKLFLGGENILDIIKRATPTIKHSQDTRETVTENDLWGQWVETTSDGTIIIHDGWVTNPNASNYKAWDTSITKIEDNKAYIGDTFFANVQTENIKDGNYMFDRCTALTSFTSDFSSLTYGQYMFYRCTALTSFTSDLSSLMNGYRMFYRCTALTSFTSDSSGSPVNLYNLTNGDSMFASCFKLTSFDSDLSSLTNGTLMFMGCNLESFSSDLPSLTNGDSMFFGCTALTSFSSDLSSLTNGDSMFKNCLALTSITSDLSSLTYGQYMFYRCTALTAFTLNLSSLENGYMMFYNCDNLTSFSSNLSSLTYGYMMFFNCDNLESFTTDLPNLPNGYRMFYNCPKLNLFSSDLSSLTYCKEMFYNCTALTTFTSDLPSLENGEMMFYNCTALTSISSNLSSLVNGINMFKNCSNLTSLSSDLSNLINGKGMFYNCTAFSSLSSDLSNLTCGGDMFAACSLGAESVMYVADTIKDITVEKQLYIDGTIPYITLSNGVYSAPRGFMSDGKYIYTYNNHYPYTNVISASDVGKLTLGINVSNNADTIQQQLEDFAKAATFDSWSDLKKYFSDKGWTVTFQYGGTNTSITYDLRNREQIIPCSIFAKLIEIEPQGVEYDEDGNVIRENFYTDEQMNNATYCNEDASTFYDIEWGHDVTDTSSYTQFNSLEDAMASWNVFPKENIITSEE